MKVERPQGPNLGLALALFDKTRCPADTAERRLDLPDLLSDAEAFEQEFSRASADDDESSSEDNEEEKSRATPFELLQTALLPSAQVVDASVYQGVPQILLDTLQQLLVSDEQSSERQVSMALAEDVLPGVTLSVFEDGGRVVAEFICAVDQSRECLCQCAERLASDLANRLNRETRICVRTDDPEDPCTIQAEATPMGNSPLINDDSAASLDSTGQES